MDKKFNHKEAFCLMFYENTESKTGFMVWNSRDGVTPFCVFENGIEYQHAHWGFDRIPAPDYISRAIWQKGQRIFRDTIKEEGREFAIKRIAAFKGTEFELQEGSDKYNEMIETLMQDFAAPGNPTMITLNGEEPIPDLSDISSSLFRRHG